MGYSLEAELSDREVTEFLDKIKSKFGDMKSGSDFFGRLISPLVFRDIMAHFDQEEGSDGQWQGWSRIYSEHMAMIGKSGNKILQDSGRLRQSFMPGNYKPIEGGVMFFNNASVDGFPYAAAHNEGGGRLPKRDFMWLSDIAMEETGQMVLNWLAEGSD